VPEAIAGYDCVLPGDARIELIKLGKLKILKGSSDRPTIDAIGSSLKNRRDF